MNTDNQPFETREHSLTGKASLEFLNKESFNEFATKITDYNPDRFDPVALKVYAAFSGFIVTLYAVDKSRQEQTTTNGEKLPVKKFKMEMDAHTFLNCVKSFDLVVSDDSFDIKDIEVINR